VLLSFSLDHGFVPAWPLTAGLKLPNIELFNDDYERAANARSLLRGAEREAPAACGRVSIRWVVK
jgi:hypothetical protein